MAGTFLAVDEISPYVTDKETAGVLDLLPDDEMGRAIVRLTEEEALAGRWHSREWYRTTDLRTGLEVEIRSAPCGAGCHCGAEVRLAKD
jgi:hypothetical protein